MNQTVTARKHSEYEKVQMVCNKFIFFFMSIQSKRSPVSLMVFVNFNSEQPISSALCSLNLKPLSKRAGNLIYLNRQHAASLPGSKDNFLWLKWSTLTDNVLLMVTLLHNSYKYSEYYTMHCLIRKPTALNWDVLWCNVPFELLQSFSFPGSPIYVSPMAPCSFHMPLMSISDSHNPSIHCYPEKNLQQLPHKREFASFS